MQYKANWYNMDNLYHGCCARMNKLPKSFTVKSILTWRI